MQQANGHALVEQRQQAYLLSALGVVGPLLRQPGVVGIQVNPDGRVWIVRHGTSETATDYRLDAEQRERVIRQVASDAGLECHAEEPTIRTAILGTKMRFAGALPPVVEAPSFVIRIPAIEVYTLDQYIADAICTTEQAEALRQAVVTHRNIVVAGGIRSGKSTLCNALLQIMAGLGERIITIEVNPELQCLAPNWQAMYVSERRSMEQLVQFAMALDPRRIVIGEMLDRAAVQVVRAWNTGHPGGSCTVHANGPEETLLRIEQLMPVAEVAHPKEEIGQAIQVIAYMEQTETGRVLKSVTAVQGWANGAYRLERLA